MLYFSTDQERQIRVLMRECGQLAQKLGLEQFEVSEKGPNDYVTSIDRCLDRRLLTGFSELFPEDGTITEENLLSRAAFHANYRRIWCIDPIDGTEEFIHKKLYYAVMVGLLCDREPVAGWIYAPAFDKMYWGGKDWGLFQAEGEGKSQLLAIAPPPTLTHENCKIILGDRDHKNYACAIAQLIPEAQFYSLGSFGLKVLEVVLGRAGLYLYFNGRVKVWDTAGPLALAKAAGLVCCDLDGEPLAWTPDAVDAATLAHKQAIAIGWPEYIEAYRDKIRQAVRTISRST